MYISASPAYDYGYQFRTTFLNSVFLCQSHIVSFYLKGYLFEPQVSGTIILPLERIQLSSNQARKAKDNQMFSCVFEMSYVTKGAINQGEGWP